MLILGVDTTRDRLVAVLSDENKTYYKVSDEGNKNRGGDEREIEIC